MAEIQLAPARDLRAVPSPFIDESSSRSIATWRTGPDEAVAAGVCCESNASDRAGAVPDDANAIRYRFDEDEPPAVVFSDQAMPGALVSWAWSQLMALDALLAAGLENGSGRDGEPDVAGAVRTVLVPVINALRFSELRAAEMQDVQIARQAKGRKSAAGRKKTQA